MTSTRASKLTLAALSSAILMAVVATLLFAMPNGAFAAEPDRPTALTATAVDHDTVSLTWSHPDPATVDHYQVLSRRVDSGTRLSQVGTSTTTSFEHDGLEPESTYIYRVKPVNAAGEEGRRSARAEATTPADDTPAPAPEPTPVPDPTPAQPQRSDDDDQGNIARSSHNVLVSNTGKTFTNASHQTDRSQSFQTGTHSDGYDLASVTVYSGGTVSFSASIWDADSDGAPSTLLHLLTEPSTFTANTLTFTAPPNATLASGTTYAVRIGITAGTTAVLRRTTSNDEDAGAADGWEIGDTYQFYTSGTDTWAPTGTSPRSLAGKPLAGFCARRILRLIWHGGDLGNTHAIDVKPTPTWGETRFPARLLGIAILGTAATATASDDATLSDLELADNNNTNITLTPTFASGTTTYTANVVNSVDEITIMPSVNDSNATYEVQNNSGTALTDSDTGTAGFQVDLSVGANIIKVEVEAEGRLHRDLHGHGHQSDSRNARQQRAGQQHWADLSGLHHRRNRLRAGLHNGKRHCWLHPRSDRHRIQRQQQHRVLRLDLVQLHSGWQSQQSPLFAHPTRHFLGR